MAKRLVTDFSATGSNPYFIKQAKDPGRITKVGNDIRLEARSGDTDVAGSGPDRVRSEIYVPKETIPEMDTEGAVSWVAFCYESESGPSILDSGGARFQIHGPNNSGQAQVFMTFNGGNAQVRLWDAADIDHYGGSSATSAFFLKDANGNNVPFAHGKKFYMVLRMVTSITAATGRVSMWYNGIQFINDIHLATRYTRYDNGSGYTTFAESNRANYPKFGGIYALNSQMGSTSWSRQRLVALGDGAETLASMTSHFPAESGYSGAGGEEPPPTGGGTGIRPVFDAKSSASVNGTLVNVTHTVAGTNRAAFVFVGTRSSTVIPNNPTWAGVSLGAPIHEQLLASLGGVRVWRIVAPPLGASLVEVSFAGGGAPSRLVVASFNNVLQTAPNGTPQSVTETASGQPTISLTALSDELVIDFVTAMWTSLGDTFTGVGAGQTARDQGFATNTGVTIGVVTQLSEKPGAGGTLTLTHTKEDAGADWIHTAIVLKPIPSAGTITTGAAFEDADALTAAASTQSPFGTFTEADALTAAASLTSILAATFEDADSLHIDLSVQVPGVAPDIGADWRIARGLSRRHG